MKHINAYGRKATLTKKYSKDTDIDTIGIDSLKKALKISSEVYLVENSDYSDGSSSVTVKIHFKE